MPEVKVGQIWTNKVLGSHGGFKILRIVDSIVEYENVGRSVQKRNKDGSPFRMDLASLRNFEIFELKEPKP